MSLPIDLLLILFLIGINAILATGELALISARRSRLAALEVRGGAGAARARHLAENPSLFLPTVQTGLTLIGIMIGVVGGQRLADLLRPLLLRLAVPGGIAGQLALAAAVLLETYLTLVLGELVPKQLALRHPEKVAVVLAPAIAFLTGLAAPLVWLLSASSNLVLKLLGVTGVLRESVTEEDLRAVLAEGAEVGVLESEERAMIERLLRLADKPVRAIMTARTELDWIDASATREAIVAKVTGSAHSRFVVCDGSVDNVLGVIQAKDLLDQVLAGNALAVGTAVRQPAVMPDTVTALDALEQLKHEPLGMALVMDEYGSFEGVVTAADVLGAIIGEAGDPAPIMPGDAVEAEYEFDGLMPADELEARLNLPDRPPGSFHTLGGLVLALLRRVPKPGDRIVFGGWRFEVMAMEGRRVARVRLTREPMGDG